MIEYSPAILFSALLSLLLEWFPGLSTWWAMLTPAKRTTINALGVALISIAAMLYSCRYKAVCPADTMQAILNFLLVALLSLGVNQGVHQVSKRRNFDSTLWG